MSELDILLKEIRACAICKGLIPEPIKPFLQADTQAKILIAGQAPGKKVHETGIIFNDPSQRWCKTGRLICHLLCLCPILVQEIIFGLRKIRGLAKRYCRHFVKEFLSLL